MIIGIGVDIVDIKRIQKICNEQFKNKIMTKDEQSTFTNVSSIAGVWAAKEAVSKALGTGFGNEGVTFLDIVISKDKLGKPWVQLVSKAKQRMDALFGVNIFLSISHEEDYAVAYVIIEG